jgi:hypothetical protein
MGERKGVAPKLNQKNNPGSRGSWTRKLDLMAIALYVLPSTSPALDVKSIR